MSSQRDIFLTHLLERAKVDKDIYLISVDMGAPSLDRWREELPDQFFAAGISEQNAINFAAGLVMRRPGLLTNRLKIWHICVLYVVLKSILQQMLVWQKN